MIKNCLVCGEELYRSVGRGVNKSRADKRRVGKHQVTCGGKCSKIYMRIATYLKWTEKNAKNKK